MYIQDWVLDQINNLFTVLANILHILINFAFFRYPEDVSLYNPEKEDQLTQFLNEVSKVFKDELVIQMNLAKKGTSISLSNNFNHQIWSTKIYNHNKYNVWKKGDVRIVRRTLRGSKFLLGPNYEFLVGHNEIFKKWNKKPPPIISIHIVGICYLFHHLNYYLSGAVCAVYKCLSVCLSAKKTS